MLVDHATSFVRAVSAENLAALAVAIGPDREAMPRLGVVTGLAALAPLIAGMVPARTAMERTRQRRAELALPRGREGPAGSLSATCERGLFVERAEVAA